MERTEAIKEIRSRWREFYQRDRKGGIICPLCGSGSGHSGTGITANPKKAGQLTCWACDFKGDIIDLIGKEKGLEFNEALKAAADELHIAIDSSAHSGEAWDSTKGREYKAQHRTNEAKTMQPAQTVQDYRAYYQTCCERRAGGMAYLSGRGISEETAAAYNIGYDPAWISPTTVKRLQEQGNEWRPNASARVIIPVTNNHYIARATDSSTKKEFAKMNETGGGNVGIFNLPAVYTETDAVFITEGAIDALSIIEAGAAAVALNSTSNADLLLKEIESSGFMPTATFILCLDNDDKGRKANKALADGLQRLNISHITADICGSHKDPNEALTADREAFKKAVASAIHDTAAKPDNTQAYIDNMLLAEIASFSRAGDKKTGFSNLDARTGGLYSGLYVVAALSSLGKTTFSLQMADQLAAAGNDVLFFSLEQSRLELVTKSLARLTAQDNIEAASNSLDIRKGNITESVKRAMNAYKKRIGDRLSIIEGNFNCDMGYIGDYIRRYIKNTGGRPVVFVDYLQILQPTADPNGKRQTVKETVDSTVTELKRLTRELDITVIVISSLNRANYLTPVDFESLKESGNIEYTADCVYGLQLQCLNDELFAKEGKVKEKRDKVREAKEAVPREIQLVCLKNRYGRLFECNFSYDPVHDLYTPVEEFRPVGNDNPFAGGNTISI